MLDEKILLIGAHGAGDCLLSLQCANYIPHTNFAIYLSCRPEVFAPIEHAFKDEYLIQRIDESYGENNNILQNTLLLSNLQRQFDFVYYIIPDLLFRNPLAFPWRKYNVHPQVIKNTRLLTHKASLAPFVYLGLCSTTPGYTYEYIEALAIKLAETLPHLTIYLPWVSNWAGQNIPQPNFSRSIPDNLEITIDKPFTENLDLLKQCSYFIGTDNGVSHFAFHYGIPRLILDPQFNRLPWIARWKEDYSESIPISTPPDQVVKLVEANVNVPQTCLVPRMHILSQLGVDWAKTFLFKY